MNKYAKLPYSILKRMISPRLKDRLAVKFFGYSKIYNLDEINLFQLRQTSNSQVISNKDFLPHVFSVFYGEKDPNQLVPGADIPFAQSFALYYKGITNLVIYNFFSKNYGIRDPILYRIIALSDSKVISSFNKILPADSVLILGDDFGDFTNKNLPLNCSILIQAFHPRIKTPAGQLRFLAIYHDAQKGIVSGIHSMQLPMNGIASKWEPAFRSYGFSDTPAFISTCTNSHEMMSSGDAVGGGMLSRLNAKRPLAGQNAYMTLESNQNIPQTIWHDGPVSHSVKSAQKTRRLSPCRTAFFVPDFQCHAPILFFSEFQVGFLTSQMTISAFNQNRALLAVEKVPLKASMSSIDLKALFIAHKLSGSISFVVNFERDLGEFQSSPACYLHIYYRSPNGYADQVHSDSTIGYGNDPLKKLKSYRCRKFAPFIKNSQLKFIYSIINVGGSRTNPDHSINVRIISDKRVERVLRFDVPAEGITTIHADDLVRAIDDQIERTAIVQLEHETTNYNGVWFCIDQKTRHLGVDHFTGG